MQKEVTFVNWRYNKSSSHLEQGVKGGKVPKGAVAGGNGSFTIATPSSLIIEVEDKSKKLYHYDISESVRNYYDGKLTLKRACRVCEALRKQESFQIEELCDCADIVDLDDIMSA